MLFLVSIIAVFAANDAPTIDAGPEGIIISVPVGLKVYAR